MCGQFQCHTVHNRNKYLGGRRKRKKSKNLPVAVKKYLPKEVPFQIGIQGEVGLW